MRIKALTENKELEKYRQELTNQLLSIPLAHLVSGDTAVAFRCPYCGDSKTDRYKTRFYVILNFLENEAPYYKCHNGGCDAKGILTTEVLKDLQLESYTLLNRHNMHMKNIKKSIRKKIFMEGMKLDLTIPMPIMHEGTKRKLAYINNRLRIQLTGRDILKYKIVVNLYDFLEVNNIDKITRDKYITDKLDKDYFGFLSADNNYLVMRNVTNNITKTYKRYINYNVLGAHENIRKFYIMPNNVDIMEDVEIIITEGILDIIGVYNHIYDKDDRNRIFVAACGTGMESVIRYLLRIGFIHHKIKIYSDADVSTEFYEEMKKNLKGRINGNITVYYNKKEKDYGVPKEDIELYKTII